MAGEGVPQQMRMHALEQALALRELAQTELHRARGDRRAAAAGKHRCVGLPPRFSAPVIERFARMRANRDAALLAAFAQHRHQAVGKIQIAPAQRAQFAQAQTGAVEQFEDRAVAQAQRYVGRQLDQLHRFIDIQHLRQFARRFRRTDTGGWTGDDATVLQQPLIETAAGRESTLQAFRRQAATMLGGDERTQLFGVHGREIFDALRAEDVQSSALLPLPGLGLIAVGSREPNRFFPGMGTLFLRMMGEAFDTAMRRFEG